MGEEHVPADMSQLACTGRNVVKHPMMPIIAEMHEAPSAIHAITLWDFFTAIRRIVTQIDNLMKTNEKIWNV